MKFEIHSHEGAGPIRFGMTTTEVREAMGEEFESFMKGSDSEHPTDVFTESQCYVFYDASGKVKAIEFWEPAQPTLGGVDLLGLSYADLVKLIRAQDPDVEVNLEGFESLNLGIGSYAPDGEDEPESPAETVIVFRRGYYD
jgi:hypothetical protein